MTYPPSLVASAERAGLSVGDLQAILAGDLDHHRAAPALLHAYRELGPSLPGPSDPDAFELGLRLRAAAKGGVARRAAIVPAFRDEQYRLVSLARSDTSWFISKAPTHAHDSRT